MAQRPTRHSGGWRRLPLVWDVTVTALAVALIPLLVLGVTAGLAQQRSLTDRAAEDLSALASAQQANLALIGDSAFNGARLVASRTQLRRDLADVLDGDSSVLPRMTDILDDARDATAELLAVEVTDPDGRRVAGSGAVPDALALAIVADLGLQDPDLDPTVVISRIEHDLTGPHWLIATPLLLEDRVLGAAITEQDLRPVRALVRGPDDRGRGIDTSVVHRTLTGETAFLVAPADFQLPGQLPDAQSQADLLVTTDDEAARLALDGEQTLLLDATDHRGRSVVTATRTLEELGWGLTVSITRDELLAPVAAANRVLRWTALGAVALAVLLAVLLARRLSQPVTDLHQAASAIRAGDLEVQADTTALGEYGELAQTFNEMTTAIRTHQRDLEQRYADLEVLTHAMAHDLKGPLTTVTGVLELLGSDRPIGDEDRRRLIDAAVGASARMQRLIDDLLALARALGAPLGLAPVDLDALARRLVTQLQLDEVAEVEPLPTVAGDAVLLEQLLVNLLNNAAAYHQEGEPPRIRVSSVDAGSGQVELRVDDAGVGIEPEERTAVLEPFIRGGRTSHTTGSGLGLSIVARVVERHEGRLHLDDSPLGGARIAVTLPLAVEADGPASDAEEEGPNLPEVVHTPAG